MKEIKDFSQLNWSLSLSSSLSLWDLMCLTDCSQSASGRNSPSLHQECRDEEDAQETSTKEEDKHNFMDFPVREVAEQLTRLDAVGFINKYLQAPLCVTVAPSFLFSSYLCIRSCLCERFPSTA